MGSAHRALVVAVLAVALAGCGGGDRGAQEPPPATGTGRPLAGGGGVLRVAIPALPSDLDPLFATSRVARTIVLQTHEPLVSRLSGPYGDDSEQPGLAVSIRPSRDRTIWTLHLRSLVRFHDGTPFNAAAVLANARRWITLAAGRKLLPTLFAVDAPRPDVVRFICRSSTPDLGQQLSSPRLGVVSPQALRPRGGRGARVVGNGGGPGTAGFEFAQITSDRIDLQRFAAWWGSPLGLGPSLDAVEFRAVSSQAERLRLLQDSELQIAAGLSPRSLELASHDPLLTTLGGPGGIGLQRSVRGIDSAAPVAFTGAWLTTVKSVAP